MLFRAPAYSTLVLVVPVCLAACAQSAPTDSASSASPASDSGAEASQSAESAAPTPSGAPSEEAPTAQLALPSDAYFAYDWLLFNAGQVKALNTCLHDKGVDLNLPEVVYDPQEAKDDVGFENRHYLLTVDRAKERGYRRLPPPPAFKAFDEAFSALTPTLTPTQTQAIGACTSQMTTEQAFLYPFDAEDYAAFEVTPTFPKEPSWLAFMPELSRGDEQGPWKTGQDWRACMADGPLDVSGNQPVELPTAEMKAMWFQQVGQIEEVGGTPSQEEIDFATKDAECRESSGYNQRAYELQVDYLNKDISEHKDRYETIKRKIEEKTTKVKEYLGV